MSKNFRYYLSSKVVSEVGNGFHSTAVMLLLYSLTESSVSISIAMIAFTIPYLLFSSYAGTITDRMSCKRILMICDLIRIPLVLIIPFVSQYILFVVLIFVYSSIATFYGPAEAKLLPQIVAKDKLLNANSIMSLSRSIPNFVIGASVCGLLFQVFGKNAAFYIDSVTFFVSFLLLSLIKYDDIATRSSNKKKSSDKFKDGISAIKGNRIAQMFILIMIILNFTSSTLNINLLVYTSKILESSSTYGFLIAANGIGAILGALIVNKFRGVKPSNILILSLLVSGIVNVIFPSLSALVLLLSAYIITGIINTSISVYSKTSLQVTLESDILGTVFGMLMSVMSIAPLISLLLGGTIIELLGPERVYILVGSIKLVCIIPILFLGRKLDNNKENDHEVA